ncbi:MAG: crosslink repair DNA glycosylase YcaQ family protein [Ilumatobacteraceae bacterium]
MPANVRRLTRDEARRIAIRAQLLDADRPADLSTVANQLTFLQLDPTAAVAPSADLVAWSRIGNSYDPAQLRQALEHDHTLFEHRGQDTNIEPVLALMRPMADVGLYLGEMAELSAGRGRVGQWLKANDAFRRRVMKQLAASGPLSSRDIPDTAKVPWESSGWTHDRNVTQMLEFLATRGHVAVAGRRGKQRIWDLAERIYPADAVVVPVDEAHRIRDEKRLRSLGVARPQFVGVAGDDVEVKGTAGLWRVDPKATAKGFEGRTALLSPFDRLIHNRVRAAELFDFEYTLEMYKPKEQRRWGFFALPVLHGDRLVGKADVLAERKASVLQVNAVHQDVKFTKAMTVAVNVELESLAAWLELAEIRFAMLP